MVALIGSGRRARRRKASENEETIEFDYLLDPVLTAPAEATHLVGVGVGGLPVVEPPVGELPVVEPPRVEPPRVEPVPVEPVVVEPVVVEPLVPVESVVVEPPDVEWPVVDPPVVVEWPLEAFIDPVTEEIPVIEGEPGIDEHLGDPVEGGAVPRAPAALVAAPTSRFSADVMSDDRLPLPRARRRFRR